MVECFAALAAADG